MKILRISANNFKLCENNFTICFTPVANKTQDDKEFELQEIAENLYTFSTIAIVGKNASGKTTTFELLNLVYEIFFRYRIQSHNNFINDKMQLDVCFYHEEYLYRYTTEIHQFTNVLDDTTIFKNQKLYKRKYKKSYANNLYDFDKYESVEFDTELPNDTSILYHLLKELNVYGIYFTSNDMYNLNAHNALYKILNNTKTITRAVLKMFDEHINNIETLDNNKFKITFSNKNSLEVTEDELFNILSSGTKKGFCLFSYVIASLKLGIDLVVDEIENHFHKTLVENLINLYKDKSVNKNNATLIFTTHNCELLDMFNRSDNIYISKYSKKIVLENMYTNYKIRPELLKSKKYYENAFNTNVDYDTLMNFKKELM